MGAGERETLAEELAAVASCDRGEAAGFTAALACAQAAALLELTATLAGRRLDSDEMAALGADGAGAVVAAGDWPFTPDARVAEVMAEAAGRSAGLVVDANRERGDGA